MNVKTVLIKVEIKYILSKMKSVFKVTLLCLLFSISACNTEDNNDIFKFEGNWLVNEKSSILGQRIYEIEIFKDSLDNSRIHIFNFYKLGIDENILSTYSNPENILNIEEQIVKDNLISGSGTTGDGKIILTYFINDGNEVDTVNSTYTKENI